jgi:hypothetical protein
MVEEQETTGGSLKNILIGLVSTVTLGVGGFITNKLTGGEEEGAKTEVAAPAPVINITNSNQQSQQAAAGGKTVIIKEKTVPSSATQPAAQPAPAKPVKTETEKRKEEGLEW